MATLKIVPQNDWEILSKYINKGQDVILVPEEELGERLASIAGQIRSMEGYVNYSFGGEPDVSVDILLEYPSFQASELGFSCLEEDAEESE